MLILSIAASVLVLVQHATGYSKLEKADILELAVKYLRNIRGQQISGIILTFEINVRLTPFITHCSRLPCIICTIHTKLRTYITCTVYTNS